MRRREFISFLGGADGIVARDSRTIADDAGDQVSAAEISGGIYICECFLS
jgi:hypothetical protein